MSAITLKSMTAIVSGFFTFLAAASGTDVAISVAETRWMLNELTVAEEERCSPYERGRHYFYSQDVESLVAEQLGGIYGPYTGTCFASLHETSIEHIVALSEAHDSGLCAAPPAVRRQFASDLRNLTLASSTVNKEKSARDAAHWQPRRNRCWFAARVIDVRSVWGLTIDADEKAALSAILDQCDSTALEVTECHVADALMQYDDNRNGRITCSEARAHGIAPVLRSHPAYAWMTDGDNDGKVCE